MKSWALLLLIPHLAFAGHMYHEPPPIKIQDSNPLVTTRPQQPRLVAPQALATVDAGDVTLSWDPVEGSDFYNVQVATDPGFYFNVVDQRYFSDTKITATGLKPGTTYFWRVAAGQTHNSPGYGKGTFTTQSFTTRGNAPAAEAAASK